MRVVCIPRPTSLVSSTRVLREPSDERDIAAPVARRTVVAHTRWFLVVAG
jgi:hypothetical protein